MNKYEFMKDMLSRNMSLADIERKYKLTDCVSTYLTVKQEYTKEQINNIIMEVYYNGIEID